MTRNDFDATCAARDQFWKSLGALDPYVVTHAINPALGGGPLWPNVREAYATIRRPASTIVASNGLTDPFDDTAWGPNPPARNGFGLEVYVESAGNLAQTQTSWQFDLVYQISQYAVSEGALQDMLHELIYVSVELYDIRVPKEWRNSEGRAGVLLGIKSTDVPARLTLPLETVDIVNVKLLTPKELEFVIEGDAPARQELTERFAKQGHPTFSSLERPSVV